LVYLGRLKEAAERYHCKIHAYALMTNHIHILTTPSDTQGITRMMQYIGRHYVPCINHTYGGSGSIWEGRYKALFKVHIEDCDLVVIRKAWQTGTPFGNDYFRQKIEDKLGCKVGQDRRGRPNLKLESA
jgi:REP element-mobilizing transposase RayT